MRFLRHNRANECRKATVVAADDSWHNLNTGFHTIHLPCKCLENAPQNRLSASNLPTNSVEEALFSCRALRPDSDGCRAGFRAVLIGSEKTDQAPPGMAVDRGRRTFHVDPAADDRRDRRRKRPLQQNDRGTLLGIGSGINVIMLGVEWRRSPVEKKFAISDLRRWEMAVH